MRTAKPISTISFNTVEFLKMRLDELLKARVISVWHFIKHIPESDDEAGKKEHCHLYVEPAKLISTDELKDQFKELDPARPEKPKGCLNFRNSSFAHWYLYGLHDKKYLKSKMMERKYHYTYEDIMTSDEDELYRASKEIEMEVYAPIQRIKDGILDGKTFDDLVYDGTIPIPQINAWLTGYEIVKSRVKSPSQRRPHSARGEERKKENE